jgi:hypothetical protein
MQAAMQYWGLKMQGAQPDVLKYVWELVRKILIDLNEHNIQACIGPQPQIPPPQPQGMLPGPGGQPGMPMPGGAPLPAPQGTPQQAIAPPQGVAA